MPITGKLELTIKINEFPVDVRTVENGWKEFKVKTDAGFAVIKVKPKMFKKLEEAQANYPEWVGAIAGSFGDKTEEGFILEQPNIQVFERKKKAEATA